MQKSCAGPFMPVIAYIIYPHIWLKAGVISRLFTSFFICIFDSSRLYRRCCCSDYIVWEIQGAVLLHCPHI